MRRTITSGLLLMAACTPAPGQDDAGVSQNGAGNQNGLEGARGATSEGPGAPDMSQPSPGKATNALSEAKSVPAETPGEAHASTGVGATPGPNVDLPGVDVPGVDVDVDLPNGDDDEAPSAGAPGSTGAPPSGGPRAGNLSGQCIVPPEAAAADTSSPDHVIGDGTPASCTADAVIDTIALGGVITFDCGPEPIEITLDRPAKIVNDSASDIVIDGGGLVTLSGGDRTRILYMNTCDPAQVFTTPHCDNQDTPRLTVQNLTFVHGNSTAELEYAGGGAIWARGGQLKVVGSRFFNNTCVDTGPDVGGAAIRAFSQYENRPITVVGSTFGGAEGYGNACANGGGISSINVSWSIYNSLFSHNRALGNGGNPAEEGTPGGGSGGAIYSDGMSNTLSVCGTRIEDNQVNAYGSGIFFVNNDHGGDLKLDSTVIRNNRGGGWNVLPGVSMHEDTEVRVLDSLLEL